MDEIAYPMKTALFAGVFALALVPLTLQVGLMRLSTEIFFGDGGDMDLARRRAAQSNFVQYVPFALLLLALCEMAGTSEWFIWSSTMALLVGRTFHAHCFLFSDGLGNSRAIGMIITLCVYLVLGGALVHLFATQ